MSRVERKTHCLKLAAKQWTPFAPVTITGEIRDSSPHMKHVSKIFANSRFRCDIFNGVSSVGGYVHLVVTRHGLLEPPTHVELQRIKNELFGADIEAVEIYPAGTGELSESIRHLWLLPSTFEMPFGFRSSTAYGGV